MLRASAQDRLDALTLLGIHGVGGFKQRGVAQDDGEGVVQLARDVAGQLAQPGKLFRIDQFFQHHGLASGSLDAGCQHFNGKQLFSAELFFRVAQVGQQESSIGGGTAVEGSGHDLSEMQAGEIVAGNQPGFETQGEGLAMLGGRRGRSGRQKTG